MSDVIVKNVDRLTKHKALFVLQSKGKNLSDAVREMLNKEASQFEKLVKGE